MLERRVIFDHLLLYTKEGTGWVGIGPRRHRVRPGTLYLIRPRIVHWQKADRGVRLRQYYLHFDFVQRPDSPEILHSPANYVAALRKTKLFRPDRTILPAYYLPEKIRHHVPADYEAHFFAVARGAAHRDLVSQLRTKSAMIELLVWCT